MDTNRAVPTVAHPGLLPGLPSLLNPPMMNLNQNSPINILRPPLQPLSVLPTQFIPPTVLPGMTNPLTPSSNVFPQIQPRPAPTNSTAISGIRMIPSAPTTIPAEGPVPELTFMELQEVMTKLKKDLRTKKGKLNAY